MPTDNLIQWLAQGPFPFFALVIGAIVSIDVCVVEFTRDYERPEGGMVARVWTRRMRWMALWHALFHSLSFYLYIMLIYLIQYLAFFPIDFFDLPDGVGLGLLTLINFLVVCFIWWTYRSKIKEDHSEKSDDATVLERRDMKLFVDLVRAIAYKFKFGNQARGVAVAGSVAVDMLAISALLKLYLLPHNDAAPLASFFGNVYFDVLLFALIIFATVFVLVFVAQAAGLLVRQTFSIVVVLRFAEPLAVFWILAGTVRALMQFMFGDYGDQVHRYGILTDGMFALVVVISLVVSNGLSWDDLTKIYKRRSNDAQSSNPPITFAEILVGARKLLPAFSLILAILVVVISALGLAYSTEPGRDTHNHLIEATGIFSTFVLLLTIVFLYVPSTNFDGWETSETANFSSVIADSPWQYWSRLCGVALGLAALNTFNLVAFGRSFEVDAIALWSGYVVLIWAFFDLRCWRFHLVERVWSDCRRVNDADFAELISTIGVVSAVVALFATWFVSKLVA